MRLKDIEKNLKDERDAQRVPDVYARVQKAPLNKLLEGESPARAFQKQVAMRLLVTVLLLFAVAALCIGALWLTETPSPAIPECRVTVSVLRDGQTTVYEIVFKNEYDVASAMKRREGDPEPANAEVIGATAVGDIVSLESGDSVTLFASSSDLTRAVKVANRVLYDLRSVYGDIFDAEEIGVQGE